MYIGKLNDRIGELQCVVTKKNLRKAPAIAENGNPFVGERLCVKWTELLASGVDLHVRAPGFDMLSTVVVYLGMDSAPGSVSVYTENKERLLDRYSGETGKGVAERVIELHIEEAVEAFVIELEAEFSDIVIENIEIYGASFDGERLFPTPSRYVPGEGSIAVAALDTYSADCSEAERAAEILAGKLEIAMTPAADAKVRFARCGEIAANAYALEVTSCGVNLRASDLKGFVQGVETLVKLAADGEIPACTVHDEPFMGFRGVHLYLPAEDQMDFAKSLIRNVLSPMGYNTIIFELAGAMQYESHPEINAAFELANAKHAAGEWPVLPHGTVGGGKVVRKPFIRDIVAYARSYGIDVIPEIQSLGHVQFMTLAHPEIAERPADAPVYEDTDERLADVPPIDFYAHCACPSNPKTYQILFEMIDEIVDTFEPREYVHMGHDEVYQIGVCPVCKDKDPADLYAGDVLRIHEYLAAKGLKMMIWADMLQPDSPYKTVSAISRLPKDIFMLDFIWYFHPAKDIEDNLLAQGFEVGYGNMYSSHFPRYESRIRKAGVRGAEVSAWVPTAEKDLAREGKLYDFLYSGQMLWSAGYTGHARYAYDRVVAGLIPSLRERLKGVKYPSREKDSEAEVLADNSPFDPAAPCGCSLEVDGCWRSLVIEHAAESPCGRIPWVDLDVIGHYAVTYADGVREMIPVTYAGNVSCWNRRHNQPFTHMYYRHNGYSAAWETDGAETRTPDGRLATLYCFEWINPRPGTVICRIEYVPAEDAETGVVVHRVVGIR